MKYREQVKTYGGATYGKQLEKTYLFPKSPYRFIEKDVEEFYKEMKKLSGFLNVADTTNGHFASALELQEKDFEDALQYYCAESNQCEVIVTRNKKDFAFSSIRVVTPEELLA